MKVTIQHSINLEDVPEKAHELLMPVEEKIDNAMRWLNALSRDLSTNSITAELASTSINRIRKVLGDCDITLNEVGSIMQGVADYEKESLLPPSPPPASVPTSNDFAQLEQAMEYAAKEKEQTELIQALALEKYEALKKEKETINESDIPF